MEKYDLEGAMKSTGDVRKVDKLGRISMPIALRRTFKLDNLTEYEIYIEEDLIVIKKYVPLCLACSSSIEV